MKKIGLFISLILGLSLSMAPWWAWGGHYPPAMAGPLAPDSGDWDGLSVGVPMVILNAGNYQMWYQGRGLSFYNQYGLGYAESPDGRTWIKHAGNPVLEPGDPGEWDRDYRGQIALIKDGATYKMWYSGGNFDQPWQTGYATSADGLAWDIYPSNPVLATGGPSSWDETEADGPTVIKDGPNSYKMWYHGCNLDYSVCSIGYATSSDGIHWNKYADNPVLEPTPASWDQSGLGWPRVIKKDATHYEMWYHSNSKLGYATSPDGINWSKSASNPVLSIGWNSAGVSVSTVLLDGGTYKMWTSSGAGNTRGIGYFESADGIQWNQPVSNPRLVRGESGVIIDANYKDDSVRLLTLANTPVTITVSGSGGVKATLSGVTNNNGWYFSWDHYEDWNPEQPDILPGDTVNATADGYSTMIETVGEIDAHVHNDTDMVEGTIHAPGFAPGSLSVLCEVSSEPSQIAIDQDVPANGGSFHCDFSGQADIAGCMGGRVGYLEPDGDMVSVYLSGPCMGVNYGLNETAGMYDVGHTLWITVTNSIGTPKAYATAITEPGSGNTGTGPDFAWSDGFWVQQGDWSNPQVDIQPGDRVHFRADDGYTNIVQVGTVIAWINPSNDTVAGTITAPGFAGPLQGFAGWWGTFWEEFTVDPNGGSYFVDFSPYDLTPGLKVSVGYREPDLDKVTNVFRTPCCAIHLPLVRRDP